MSLAGAGCALGVLGVLVLAGDTGIDEETGDFSRLPGVLLSALVVALGYFVLTAVGRGPLATAGAVGAALGIPAFMFFVTFDENGFPPYNAEAILIVSTVAWLATYSAGPGKGRPFFLGSGLIGLWFTVLEITENVFDFPFDPGGFFAGGFYVDDTFDSSGTAGDFGPTGFEEPTFDPPDPATVGLLSLALGVAFLLFGRGLDRRGHHGTATPFTFAAIPCLAAGVVGLVDDLEVAGSGVLLALIGLGLAYNGATIWRRATTWIGGAAMALGLALFLGDMAGDSATTGGMLFIAGGIAMVFLGLLLASALGEPDELAVTTATPEAAPPASADPDAAWKPPIPPPPGAPEADDKGPDLPPPATPPPPPA